MSVRSKVATTFVLIAAPVAVMAAKSLSPAAQALIAPVHEAYVRIQREQSQLPPPRNDSERLIRLGELDQAGRNAYARLDFSTLPEGQRQAAFNAVWDEINRIDRANQETLESMIPAGGWFAKSRYGEQAVEAAFLVVQHAVNDLGLPEYDKQLQHRVLAAMKPMLIHGEVDTQAYALLYDRVQIFDGKPQLYGTQLVCRRGKWVVDALTDPEHVNDRRSEMGFALTVEQNAARFANRPPCIDANNKHPAQR